MKIVFGKIDREEIMREFKEQLDSKLDSMERTTVFIGDSIELKFILSIDFKMRKDP